MMANLLLLWVQLAALDIPDAGAAPAPPEAQRGAVSDFAARVHEQESPLVFRVPIGNKDARTRAREAGDAMAAALEAAAVQADGEAPALVDCAPQGDAMLLRVRGRVVATLGPQDVAAEGAPSPAHYCGELETRLLAFLQVEQRRSSAQGIALHLFICVALALLALLTIRALRSAFARVEQSFEDQKSSPRPLKLFGVALLSGEAVRGASLVVFFVGRILAYCAVVLAALLGALSQFDRTRPWLGRLAAWAASPVVSGADALVRALPGLLLAALLVVIAAAAVRLVRLLLDDIRAGRVASTLDAARTEPARAVLTVAILLVFAPLVVAAAFLRFGTPLETLVLFAGAAVALGALPVLASAAVGSVQLWRGRLKVGEWLSVGAVQGEVASVQLLDVTLVPPEGGTVQLPMVGLALAPALHRSAVPLLRLAVRLKRDRPLRDLELALAHVVRSVDEQGSVQLDGAGESHIAATLCVPVTRPEGRTLLVRALVRAAEESALSLLDP